MMFSTKQKQKIKTSRLQNKIKNRLSIQEIFIQNLHLILILRKIKKKLLTAFIINCIVYEFKFTLFNISNRKKYLKKY